MHNNKPRKVFISHAHTEKHLIRQFIRLIETGMGVSTDEIFCTSNAGQGVQAGENFTGEIQKQLAKSEIAIALITTDFYKSKFCMCELGAIWGLSKRFIPILVPPIEYSDMQAVISGLHAYMANSREDLDMLFDQMKAFSNNRINTARWNEEADRFLRILPGLYRNSYYKRQRGEVFLDTYSSTIADGIKWKLRVNSINENTNAYLIVFDIDRMNQINTRHGTEVGDKILDHISSEIEAKKEHYYIEGGRCGDDTFFVLYVGDDNQALKHAEELLEIVRETPKTLNIDDLWVTASAGLSEHVLRCKVEEWKTSAHRALLEARKKGGNRCEIGARPSSHIPRSWGS